MELLVNSDGDGDDNSQEFGFAISGDAATSKIVAAKQASERIASAVPARMAVGNRRDKSPVPGFGGARGGSSVPGVRGRSDSRAVQAGAAQQQRARSSSPVGGRCCTLDAALNQMLDSDAGELDRSDIDPKVRDLRHQFGPFLPPCFAVPLTRGVICPFLKSTRGCALTGA